MKILVDRELIIKLAGLLKYSKNYYEGHNEAVSIVEDILESNPVESDGFKLDIDWCESRLQDHDGIFIEILDMFIYGYFTKDVVERCSKIKAKLVGER